MSLITSVLKTGLESILMLGSVSDRRVQIYGKSEHISNKL